MDREEIDAKTRPYSKTGESPPLFARTELFQSCIRSFYGERKAAVSGRRGGRHRAVASDPEVESAGAGGARGGGPGHGGQLRVLVRRTRHGGGRLDPEGPPASQPAGPEPGHAQHPSPGRGHAGAGAVHEGRLARACLRHAARVHDRRQQGTRRPWIGQPRGVLLLQHSSVGELLAVGR